MYYEYILAENKKHFKRKNGWFYIICKISRNILSKIEVEMLIILVIDEKHSWIYYENNDEICDFTDDIKEIKMNDMYISSCNTTQQNRNE